MKNKIKFSKLSINESGKYLVEQKSFTVLYNLTKCLLAIFFTFSLLLFLLYLMGNFQNFMDKTQLMLLTMLSSISIFDCVLSFFGILENLFLVFFNNKKSKLLNIVSILLLIIILLLSIVFIVYSSVLSKISEGI